MSAAPEPPRRLRADAQRNRDRLVAAAAELVVEHGIDVPLEAVARHAEVGIGTLYRRFPDRDELLGAVALRAFTSVQDLADALVEDRDGGRLVERFVLGIAELRVGVLTTSLMPVMVDREPDATLRGGVDRLLASVERLVEVARTDGELRDDVTADDLLLLVATLTRPLEGLPIDYSEMVTPRLLLLAVDGLRRRPNLAELPPLPPRLDPHDLRRGGASGR